MKKKLLLLLFLGTSAAQSQITVFQDSFDTYNDFLITGFGSWRTIDLDLLPTYVGGGPASNPTWTADWPNAGAPQAFMIFNPTTALVVNATNGTAGETENRNFNPRTGAKFAACWASVPSTTGGNVANEDWLVSPPINLTGATGCALSVWVKSMSDSYGLEKYRIGVYVGSGNPTGNADFTVISGVPVLTAPYPNWVERTQSLAAYDGQTIRIGIKCTTPDSYMFMVDDFKITATTLSTKENSLSQLLVYPNPANRVVNISNDANVLINTIEINDINGRQIKSISSHGVSNMEVNISDLTAGVYFMNINTDNGSIIKKIIKE